MNKDLLKNILLFQDEIEPLNKVLFNNFIVNLMSFYDFLTKEKDILISKDETKEKLKENPSFVETFQNINALNNLDISRETKVNLLKYILENNSPNNDKSICMFSMYLLWIELPRPSGRGSSTEISGNLFLASTKNTTTNKKIIKYNI